MHLHLAQGGRERLQIRGRYGDAASTVSVLREHGLLGDYHIAADCHDTDEAGRELMAGAKVRMASCQSSISMIGGIVPPLSHYVEDRGGTAGLGTDQGSWPWKPQYVQRDADSQSARQGNSSRPHEAASLEGVGACDHRRG